jgi:hypothetical protein
MANAGGDAESIAMRVVANHVARNPNAALEAAGQRHQMSGLRGEVTEANKAKQKVVAVGGKLVRELVRCKMLIAPWRPEGEVLLEVLSVASEQAFGSQWSQEDVDEIRDWCVKGDGGSVVGQLRMEVVRNAIFRNQDQMNLGA